MRILIIASEIPYPPTDANRAVGFNLLRRFRGRYEVTMLALTSDEPREDIAVVQGMVEELILVKHAFSKTFRRRLASMFTIRPFGVLLYRNADFARALGKLLGRKKFDVIIGGHINMAQYTAEIRHTPKIIAPLDAVSLYYRRQLGLSLSPAAFAYCLWQYWKVKNYERRIYSRYDACVLVARRDAEVIRELCPGVPIFFAPFGTDIPPDKEVTKHRASIVFSGVMDYPPNADAAVYFATEIFPRVKEAVPEATFHVVGKDPTAEIRALARRDAVVVTGRVPEVKEYLRRMEVAVCPIRLGAGMKMKVIEAMATAIPVVCTTRGAEGMDLVAGRDYIAADDPADFNSAVVRLLGDRRLREEYGRWGRRAVEEKYTWEAHGRAWDEIINSVAAVKKY